MYFSQFTVLIAAILLFTACTEPTDPKIALEKGDYETALRLWLERAEQDDPEAQNYLGIQYYLGLGVNRDYRQAQQWYELSATNGYANAQRNLGQLYESGKLGARDFEKAYIWLFAAYQQGNSHAGSTLATLVNKLSPNNKRLLKKKARQYILNDVVDPEDDDY